MVEERRVSLLFLDEVEYFRKRAAKWCEPPVQYRFVREDLLDPDLCYAGAVLPLLNTFRDAKAKLLEHTVPSGGAVLEEESMIAIETIVQRSINSLTVLCNEANGYALASDTRAAIEVEIAEHNDWVRTRGDAFRAVQDRNAARQDLGWRQLELRLELVERGRAFIATARERLDQIWERAEVAMSRIKERVMGEVERPQADIERGDGRSGVDDRDIAQRDAPDDMEARRAAILGRDVDRSDVQAPDFGRERLATDDPDRDRRDAILGRVRDTGQARDAAAVERDIAARDGEGRDQGLRDDILGRGRDSAPERGQGRDRDRER
jgi:hypothetical protein